MIPRPYRLILSSTKIFRGKTHHFPWGLVVTAPTPAPQWQITISKKALAKAVDRNRLRRQLSQHFYHSRHLLIPQQSFRVIINRPPPSTADLIPPLCLLLFTNS